MHSRVPLLVFGMATAFPLAAGRDARAQTYTVSVSGGLPDLGRVATPATGTSVYTVDPSSGAITRSSGSAVRMSASTTSRGTVNVACSGFLVCGLNNVKIVIARSGTPATPMGQPTNFSAAMNTASVVGTLPAPASSITFTLAAIASGSSKSFYVGMDLPVAGAASGTGAGSAGWTVTASTTAGAGAGSGSANAMVTALRPLGVSRSLDLAFGTIVRQPSGTGTVSLSPAGALSLPAGAASVGASRSAALFQVSGEGSQSVAVSVSPTFDMTAGSNTLTVTTSLTSATLALNGALGAPGSTVFAVGGSFPLGSGTPAGAYTGSFTVTAIYN